MKEGRTLQDLAVEIDRQRNAKKDFLAKEAGLRMEYRPSTGQVGEAEALRFAIDQYDMGIRDLAHDQIADRLDIPRKYYGKMRQTFPKLLVDNVNGWFGRSPDKRLVRTLDGKVRAFLSDRYRPLDNFDLLEGILPTIGEAGMKVQSAEVTETRLYIKAVNERLTGEVKKGDAVQAGVIVANSEVGCGSLVVSSMVLRLVCLNGQIMQDFLRKHHTGGKLTNGNGHDGGDEYLRDETRKQVDKALWMQVGDLVKAAVSEAVLKKNIDRMQEAADRKIQVGEIEKAVDVTSDLFSFSDPEKQGILHNLITGGDLSLYGLANAVTAYSQMPEVNYDRATELEAVGGSIIELPRQDWER